MLDLHRIIGFEWDEGNRRKSEGKHRVSQLEAEQIFFNTPLRLADDLRHSEAEPRYQALGETNEGRCLHVTFTLRHGGTLIRVISARPMSRKERIQYGGEA
jgi:uncharacterized DUF497 family protein